MNGHSMNSANSPYNGQNLSAGQVTAGSRNDPYTYSLKPQYDIGTLAGGRGQQYYVATSNPHTSGECLTGVQHLTGAPNSGAPNGPFNLHRGNAIGPDTPRGVAVATGFEQRNGQYVYPSRAAGSYGPNEGPINHAAIFVAAVDRTHSQVLAQSAGVPLHLETVSNNGWHVISGTVPPSTASTAEVRPWNH